MDFDQPIQQSHIVRYIFVVAFIFAGLFSMNSNARNANADSQENSIEYSSK